MQNAVRYTGSYRSCAGGCVLYDRGNERLATCVMGAGVHALHAVLYAALYAALYFGNREGRIPFARGARVIRYVQKLPALRVKWWRLCSMCWR